LHRGHRQPAHAYYLAGFLAGGHEGPAGKRGLSAPTARCF
jgi:hypothetical protein